MPRKPNATTPGRVKRRRTSNNANVNSAGSETYGSGIIIASNPFDDDHPLTNTAVSMKSKMLSSNIDPDMALHQDPSQLQLFQPDLHPQQTQHRQQPQHHDRPQPLHHQQQSPVHTPPHQVSILPQTHPHQQSYLAPHTQPQHYNVHSQPLQHQQNYHHPQQIYQTHPNEHFHHHPYDEMVQPHNQYNHMNAVHQAPYATNNHNVFCAKCQREVYQNESIIPCKAGCKAYFHISCSGLSQLAFELLMKESLAEWACDRCTSGSGRVPFIKYQQ